jgi:molybdopterin synthase sulfur carrier subunit
VRVLLFGPLSDLAGWRERRIEPPVASLFALRDHLMTEDAALGAALLVRGVRAAVDKTVVRGDAALSPSAEVAFLPPMSGG